MTEESILPNDKRVCSKCDSDTTPILYGKWTDKNGIVHPYQSHRWYRDGKGGWLCFSCRSKFVDHPKVSKERVRKDNQRRIAFKGRIVMLKEPPRIGVCNLCRAVVPFDCKLTHMNHYQYHEDDPLKDALESCVSCHRAYHVELIWKHKDKQCIACYRKVAEFSHWYFNEPTTHIICVVCLISILRRG
jgi:hypothetical protein